MTINDPLILLIWSSAQILVLSARTLDPDTTTTTGDQTDGTGLAAPDTMDPQTTSGTTGGEAVQCTADPPVFPEFSKECAIDDDCAVVFHQVDCCGSRAGIGIDADEVDEFNAAEAICTAQYPRRRSRPIASTTCARASSRATRAGASTCPRARPSATPTSSPASAADRASRTDRRAATTSATACNASRASGCAACTRPSAWVAT